MKRGWKERERETATLGNICRHFDDREEMMMPLSFLYSLKESEWIFHFVLDYKFMDVSVSEKRKKVVKGKNKEKSGRERETRCSWSIRRFPLQVLKHG